MLNAKELLKTYVEITESIKKEKEKLQQEVEDWKCKCIELDEENCELKKKNKELGESWKEVYQAHNKLEKENEELKIKVEELEQELIKKTIIECEPKPNGKPGRKPGVKK